MGRGGEIAMVSSNSMLFRLSYGLEMWVVITLKEVVRFSHNACAPTSELVGGGETPGPP